MRLFKPNNFCNVTSDFNFWEHGPLGSIDLSICADGLTQRCESTAEPHGVGISLDAPQEG